MIKPRLILCDAICWCSDCGRKIGKRERYYYRWKNAWRGGVRLNICSDCIREMFKDLRRKRKEDEE